MLVEVCHHLELVCREHGTPSIIQTDQGTEFQGYFDEFCNRKGIRHIRSRAYHPESQGKVVYLYLLFFRNFLKLL
jgi:transposase InsO family protein